MSAEAATNPDLLADLFPYSSHRETEFLRKVRAEDVARVQESIERQRERCDRLYARMGDCGKSLDDWRWAMDEWGAAFDDLESSERFLKDLEFNYEHGIVMNRRRLGDEP